MLKLNVRILHGVWGWGVAGWWHWGVVVFLVLLRIRFVVTNVKPVGFMMSALVMSIDLSCFYMKYDVL